MDGIAKPRLGFRWWKGGRGGDMGWDLKPAITLDLPGRQYMIRFGRDGYELFSEHMSGVNGRPKSYWYGPRGLTLRVEKTQRKRR